MKTLSNNASMIMDKILSGMKKIGDTRKLDNSRVYMPLSIEVINEVSSGLIRGKIFSLAHYFVQNGDLMADPEITYLQIFTGTNALGEPVHNYLPMTYTNHSIGKFQEVVPIEEDGTIIRLNKNGVRDLSKFTNTWMNNIKFQQNIFSKKN